MTYVFYVQRCWPGLCADWSWCIASVDCPLSNWHLHCKNYRSSKHTDCILACFSFLSSPYVCSVRSEKKVACSQLVSLCSRTKPPLLVCYAYDLHKKDRLEGFACGVKYYSSINRVRCVMSLLLSVRHKNQKNTDRKEPFGWKLVVSIGNIWWWFCLMFSRSCERYACLCVCRLCFSCWYFVCIVLKRGARKLGMWVFAKIGACVVFGDGLAIFNRI